MLRKTAMIVAGIGCMSVLLALPAAAQDRDVEDEWGPEQGDWDLTLSGSGTQDDEFDNGTASGSFAIGLFATDRSEFLLRQTVSYSDLPGAGSDTALSTRLAFDYHFGGDRFWPFLGVNFGGVYGDEVTDTWAAAPEAGIKWYIKPSTFLLLMGEYQFFFKDISDADDAFEDGQFVYTVGVGFNW